jgi:hypothetical protein
MTVAVPVAFPAYVTHVPRRARAAREVLVRGIAPVDLPEADPAGFERPWRLRGACDRGLDLEPWIRGDGLWQPLRQLAVQPGFDGLRGVTPEEFASWLAGDAAEDGPLWKGLSFAFEATPLQRRRPRADLGGLTDANLRGDPGFDDAAAGRVEADGRPEAAAAVARFLREEVVLAGDHVLMRLRPLVAFTLSQGESPWRILPYRGVSWRSLPFALGREGECQSFAERRGRIPPSEAMARLGEAMPAGPPDDHDLVVAANYLPALVQAALQPFAAGKFTLPASKAEDCAAALARISPLARRGDRGLVGRDALAEAYEAIQEAGSHVAEMTGWLGKDELHKGFEAAMRYVSEVALPRLRAPADEADADALLSLSR